MTIDTSGMAFPNAIERFFAKVKFSLQTDCWNWSASLDRDGYASFSFMHRGRRRNRGHIFAYLYFVGEIPEGLQLDHKCRNRQCVNPKHLEAVTLAVNVFRGEGVGPTNAKKTGCLNGHAFTPENMYRYGTKRICKTCLRQRGRKRYADGKKYKKKGRRVIEASPCRECSQVTKRLRRGLCNACYLRQYRAERN